MLNRRDLLKHALVTAATPESLLHVTEPVVSKITLDDPNVVKRWIDRRIGMGYINAIGPRPVAFDIGNDYILDYFDAYFRHTTQWPAVFRLLRCDGGHFIRVFESSMAAYTNIKWRSMGVSPILTTDLYVQILCEREAAWSILFQFDELIS